LGLLGLSFYSAKQRIKEVGIRKFLGESVGNIASLLSVDFLKLVFVAIIVSSPIAWWVMSKWPEGFAYKINISLRVFVLSGFVALTIAIITVSFQAIKAALMNPVKA
jgi:putative ABC transport system permease protein